ncbi:NHL domain-containing protein [Hirschfeldia incana]|nr:NHL domain-containing protein [Hirschfeldia incana]
MGREFLLLTTLILLCSSGFVSSAPSANSPAKIINGFISNHGSSLMKWIWSLKSTSTKTTIATRSMVKFEDGYSVETVFDGSKLGIEPYAIEVLPNGELLVLDSENSNIYKISSSLSLYSRPRLVTGSPEGYAGHVDGRLRDAKLNHPKGLAVDDRGNIYVADTVNNAIRKISEGGVTTIAGGKTARNGGHVDGPSEDAKFSNDFDVVYLGSSCSLLVIDRGNKAIREIQLHFDDCAYQYESGFPLGIAVLVAAGFFGYMVALLQRRVGTIVSSQNVSVLDQETYEGDADHKPVKPFRPSLIPNGDEQVEKQDESFLASMGNLASNAWVTVTEMLRKRQQTSTSFQEYQTKQSSAAAFSTATTPWPIQESFVIPEEDEPPPVEHRNQTPRKTYAFMSKDAEKMQQLRQSREFYRSWESAEFPNQQQQQQQKQQQHRRHYSSIPHTYYEENSEKTNEVVFGAVHEKKSSKRAAKPAKPKESEDQINNNTNTQQNLHHRAHSVSYPYGYYPYT